MYNQFLTACRTGDLVTAEQLAPEVSIVYRNSALIEGISSYTHDVLKMLINNGADINQLNNAKVPVFLLECQAGNINAISNFLAFNVDIHLVNIRGDGPLHFAVRSENLEAIKIILAAKDLEICLENKDAQSALIFAADIALYEGHDTSIFDLIFKTIQHQRKAAKKHCKDAINILKKSDRLDIKEYLLTNKLLSLNESELDDLLIRAREEHYKYLSRLTSLIEKIMLVYSVENNDDDDETLAPLGL